MTPVAVHARMAVASAARYRNVLIRSGITHGPAVHAGRLLSDPDVQPEAVLAYLVGVADGHHGEPSSSLLEAARRIAVAMIRIIHGEDATADLSSASSLLYRADQPRKDQP